ncbi:MAG: DUF4249 domain-containing protein [Bacteroidetes bacterium]|nr:DUF4249 domain-containing protein [Bacteroidota bacterium]
MALTTTGCDKELNKVDLPEFVSKLVVTSFISPSDSLSFIKVEANQPIYGDLSVRNSPGNLAVYISDGKTEIKLDTVNGGFSFDNSRMTINYGKSYSIRVESDKGINATASCTVPFNANFNLRVDTFSVFHAEPQGYNDWREMKVKVSFTDPAETENFYRTLGTWVAYMTFPGSTEPYKHTEYIWFKQGLLTEASKGQNGEIVNITDFNGFSFADSAFLNITLLNTEKSYYQYHKSLQNYSNGDDFFTEPKPVFSNIEGGFGVFTSYTKETVTIRLK